jgi:hypothetical protein
MPLGKLIGSSPIWTAVQIGFVLAGSGSAQSAEQSIDWVKPSLPSVPSARCCSAMAYDAASQSAVLFGGGNGGIEPPVRYGDTWIWANGWAQQFPATSPSARGGAAAAYDPITRTVVLFGGNDSNNEYLNDTWTWDGSTWTQQFPAVSPAPRAFSTSSMTYDAATGTVLMFGGASSAPLGDTWEWNGRTKTWTQRFPPTSPSPRRGPLAYDAVSKKVLLFGGDTATGDCCDVYYNDTWTWDGNTWTQLFPGASPAARAEASLAYDAEIGRVVVFGGYIIPGQGLDDTWAWNGTTWEQRQTRNQPAATWGGTMIFDPLNYGLILFGGENTGDPFTSDTWLFIPVP